MLENISQDILNKYEIHIIPVVNVDGYVYTWKHKNNRFWRKNRQPDHKNSKCIGIDNNRNWGHMWGQETISSCQEETYPGSNPFASYEISHIKKLLEKEIYKDRFFLFVDVHSYSANISGVWGYTNKKSQIEDQQNIILPKVVKDINNSTNQNNYYTYSNNFEYLISGDACDYIHHTFKNWAVLFELRPNKNKDEQWESKNFDPPENNIILGCIEGLAGVVSLIKSTKGKKPIIK